MTAQQISRHRPAPARYVSTEEIARNQFIRELRTRAQQADLDDAYRARWNKRQAAVRQDVRRERQVLLAALVVFTLLGIAAAVALTMFLMSATGLTFLACLAIAAGLSAGGSCCSVIVTVTVIH